MEESKERECPGQEYLNDDIGQCEYCALFISQDVTYCGECSDLEEIRVEEDEYRVCLPCEKFHAKYEKEMCICADEDIGKPPESKCEACGIGKTADPTHTICKCAIYFHEVGENCVPDDMMTGCLICTVLSFLVGLVGFIWWLWDLRERAQAPTVSVHRVESPHTEEPSANQQQEP